MRVSRNLDFACSPPPFFTSSGRREVCSFCQHNFRKGKETISRGTKCFHSTNKQKSCVYTVPQKDLTSKPLLRTGSVVYPFQKGKGHLQQGLSNAQEWKETSTTVKQIQSSLTRFPTHPGTQLVSGQEAQETLSASQRCDFQQKVYI